MIAPEPFEVLLLENKVDIAFFSHILTYFEEKLKDTIFIISGGLERLCMKMISTTILWWK
jgi:hypothetical protein